MRTPASVVALGLAAAVGLSACDRLGLTSAASLRVRPDSAVLPIHGQLQLDVTLHDVAATDVYFTSSDTSVAVVDWHGLAQAVGYGRAVVSAYDIQRWTLADSMVLRVPAPAGPWLVLLPDTASVGMIAGRRLAWRVGNTSDRRVHFATSDSAIAEVSDSGLVCGRGVGLAVIRATSVGDPAASDSTRVRVFAGTPPPWPAVMPRGAVATPPPAASIIGIVDTAGGNVDLNAVRGIIRVIVNVDVPPCFPPTTMALMIDGNVWAMGPDVFRAEVHSYTFTVDTRATDAGGQPRIPNGAHVLSVILRGAAGTTLASTSQAIVVAN